MQDLDHLMGANRSALVSLVEGSRCSWLYMSKAWVASKKGKRKGSLVLLNTSVKPADVGLFYVHG